jgi:nicotinamide riboside transporter PnuC
MDLAAVSGRPVVHLAAVGVFVVANGVGYAVAGGLDFVQGWGGGLAAVIATWFLVFKSQGYWAWMIVNAGLWTYLFFHVGLPMLAYLQISFLLFAGYGMVQWAIVRHRVGFDPRVRLDIVGSLLALALFAISVEVYWRQPGYRGSLWWWLELGAVVCAIAAMWMDAFRYRANWVAWTISNVLSAPLFWHGRLWGPFWTIFLYQALNCVGWVQWTRDAAPRAKAVTA